MYKNISEFSISVNKFKCLIKMLQNFVIFLIMSLKYLNNYFFFFFYFMKMYNIFCILDTCLNTSCQHCSNFKFPQHLNIFSSFKVSKVKTTKFIILILIIYLRLLYSIMHVIGSGSTMFGTVGVNFMSFYF